MSEKAFLRDWLPTGHTEPYVNSCELGFCGNKVQVVYNRWTGLVDWTGGLTFIYAKNHFYVLL